MKQCTRFALIVCALCACAARRPISLRKEMGERTAKGGDPPLKIPSKGGRGCGLFGGFVFLVKANRDAYTVGVDGDSSTRRVHS
jgi:hypothetical protein